MIYWEFRETSNKDKFEQRPDGRQSETLCYLGEESALLGKKSVRSH